MKANFVKMILPVAAFVLASAGAVGTNNAKGGGGAIQGWKRIAPFNCVELRQCNNEGSVVCMLGADQAYAKPTPSSDCTQILTHKP